jgi:hypothetical protein
MASREVLDLVERQFLKSRTVMPKSDRAFPSSTTNWMDWK